MKLEHVSNHELQRAHKFYCQAPTGQWDDEACLCIEAVLWDRGFEFETVSRCWVNHSLDLLQNMALNITPQTPQTETNTERESNADQ